MCSLKNGRNTARSSALSTYVVDYTMSLPPAASVSRKLDGSETVFFKQYKHAKRLFYRSQVGSYVRKRGKEASLMQDAQDSRMIDSPRALNPSYGIILA